MKKSVAAVIAVAVWVATAQGAVKQRASLDEFAPLSTPPGVTLQPLGKFQGYGMDQETAALIGHGQVTFADSHGMTLYTYDQDQPGKPSCVDDCAKTWPPLTVAANAKPVGEWTIVARADGTRQWALRGKPVYRYSKDMDPGSVGGNSPKRYGRGPQIGERGARLAEIPDDAPLPEGWRAALHYPAPVDGVPPDFTVKEVEDAGGLALVSSAMWTLYVFDGDVNADRKACAAPCLWKPVVAAMMAGSKGDFVPVARDDGVRQWTYKGLGLYTFAGDLARGDAHGEGVHKNWRVAHVTRDFRPEAVTIQQSHRLGKVLADARGRTLYRRDAYIFQSGSGHGQRRGVLVRPAVGRDIGTEPRCTLECEKWHPFLAPADAAPRGYWDVYTRADGARQWAYQGYALWTYDGDLRPGDINANDSWQQAGVRDEPRKIEIGTQFDGVAALYWAAAAP